MVGMMISMRMIPGSQHKRKCFLGQVPSVLPIQLHEDLSSHLGQVVDIPGGDEDHEEGNEDEVNVEEHVQAGSVEPPSAGGPVKVVDKAGVGSLL